MTVIYVDGIYLLRLNQDVCLNVPANIFSVLPHSRRLKSLQIFRFDILNLKLFNFQTAKGKENI